MHFDPPVDPGGAPQATLTRVATGLLRRCTRGDTAAGEELLPLVYDELRRLASGYLSHERRDHTLQATALVNEAWLRLIDRRDLGTVDRRHFMALAAQAMRRVLVDHARRRGAGKRGRGWERVTLSEVDVPFGTDGVDLVELDDLLGRLGDEDERLGQLATLRLFGGLTNREVAEVLDVSERTVNYDWSFARCWLLRELRGDGGD